MGDTLLEFDINEKSILSRMGMARKNEKMTYFNRHFENCFSMEVITPINDLNIHLNLSDESIEKVLYSKIIK